MHKNAFLLILALGLGGCDDLRETETPASPSSLTVISTSETTYWDLDTGNQVADPASQDWDLAFSGSTGGVFTNSGASAAGLGSGGLGGVAYSGTTEFNQVTDAGSEDFTGDFETDTSVSLQTAGPSGVTVTTAVLNLATKLEYSSGSGTPEDPFVNDGSPEIYEGPAYYAYLEGVISTSGEVYLVRHGDGVQVSKVQIVSMSGTPAERTRVIKYLRF